MKMSRISWTGVILLLFSAMFSFAAHAATTYYVATNGLDSNAGLESSPFKTLKAAVKRVKPGDTVIVQDGLYKITEWTGANLSASGTALDPITIKAAHPGLAKLYGTTGTIFGLYLEPGVSHVNIRGFDISNVKRIGIYVGDNTNIGISRVTIHHIGNVCSDDERGKVGIYIRESSAISVVRSVFRNIGRLSPGQNGCRPATDFYKTHDHGIYIDGAAGVAVLHNKFDSLQHGWPIQLFSSSGRVSTDIVVRSNVFLNPNPYAEGHIMLARPGMKSVTITNNAFVHPKGVAITFWGTTRYFSVKIYGNSITGAGVSRLALPGVMIGANLMIP